MTFLTPPRLRNSVRIVGAAVAALALLSACGGGDNMAADPIDKYIGKWESNRCHENTLLTVDADLKKTYFNYSFVFTRTSSTKASFRVIYRFYRLTEKKCDGDVIYTITKTGEKSINKDKEEEYDDTKGFSRLGENSLVYKDSIMIGDSAVDRLEFTEAPLSNKTAPFPVGSAVPQKTLSPVWDNDLTNIKAIAKINGNTLTIEGGDDYPAKFDESPETFTKQ